MPKIEDPSQYNTIDLYAAFLPFLKKYLKSKGKVFSKNVPVSVIINEIKEELANDYEIRGVVRSWGDSTMSIIMELARKGLLKLPSLRPKEKFLKKFGGIIKKLFLNKVQKVDGYSFKIAEPEPYEIILLDQYDLNKLLKSKMTREDMLKNLNLSKKFKKFLEDRITTLKQGHPAFGNIDITSKFDLVNLSEEDLIKKLRFQVNQIIRENNLRGEVTRTSYKIQKTDEGPKVYVDLVGGAWSRRRQNESIIVRELQKLGYNTNFMRVEY